MLEVHFSETCKPNLKYTVFQKTDDTFIFNNLVNKNEPILIIFVV